MGFVPHSRKRLVQAISRIDGDSCVYGFCSLLEEDAQGVAYCRRVTVIWTVFLAVHLSVTVATVFATHEIWAVYNGLVAYLLMGALFAGEWLYRRRFRRG